MIASLSLPALPRCDVLKSHYRDGLSAEFVEECLFGRKAGLDEAVHVLVWIELLDEKEIEFVAPRAGELISKKFELIHSAGTKILDELFTERTEEQKTVLEYEVFAV